MIFVDFKNQGIADIRIRETNLENESILYGHIGGVMVGLD